MSVTRDITDAIAALVADATSLVWSTDATAPVPLGGGIWRKRMPANARGVAITVVPRTDDITEPIGSVMIQLKAHGAKNDPNGPDDLLDDSFTAIQGRTAISAGSCSIIQINRGVSVPSTVDDTGVWERIDQYYADVDYPPTTLRPEHG